MQVSLTWCYYKSREQRSMENCCFDKCHKGFATNGSPCIIHWSGFESTERAFRSEHTLSYENNAFQPTPTRTWLFASVLFYFPFQLFVSGRRVFFYIYWTSFGIIRECKHLRKPEARGRGAVNIRGAVTDVRSFCARDRTYGRRCINTIPK